jgi:hypothetical protein
MKMTELKNKAKGMGIKPGRMKKTDLVHTIQKTEGNTPCYGTTNGNCDQIECCYRDACLKITAGNW